MKKVMVIGNAFIVLGALLLVMSLLLDTISVLLSILGIVLVCIGFLFFSVFWRCPVCHAHLPFRGMIALVFCPYCGSKIDS